MPIKINRLKNKKIAIIGFGAEGKSLARFLKKKKVKNISILDQNNNLKIPKFFKNRLGINYLKDLNNFDLIFLSPGINPNTKELQKVKSKLSSSTELFFDNFKGIIIGVTGTKGKGTTARLVYQIVKKLFPRKKIFLGGNIGKPLVCFLDKANKYSIVIAELSSFQLQNLKQSPQIAIVTNLNKDHLNYHRSLKEYHQAKLNILKFQNENNLAILNLNLRNKTKKIGKAKRYYFSLSNNKADAYFKNKWLLISNVKIIKEPSLKALGPHIKEDILAATLTAYLLKPKKNKIAKIIKIYKPDKHRLELFYKKNGISFYNDSASTNPLSTISAIKSFKNNIILIIGGQNKGFNYKKLTKQITKQENIKFVLIFGENREELKSLLKNKKAVFLFKNLEEITKKIKKIAKQNDIILLSPASASLDMFKNYKQRGEFFKKLIKESFN